MSARRDYWVTVCSNCLCASCWHGEFYCQRAKTAATKRFLASELRKLRLEHPSNYSVRKLVSVGGDVEYAASERIETREATAGTWLAKEGR